jgi:hypothetical protein
MKYLQVIPINKAPRIVRTAEEYHHKSRVTARHESNHWSVESAYYQQIKLRVINAQLRKHI